MRFELIAFGLQNRCTAIVLTRQFGVVGVDRTLTAGFHSPAPKPLGDYHHRIGEAPVSSNTVLQICSLPPKPSGSHFIRILTRGNSWVPQLGIWHQSRELNPNCSDLESGLSSPLHSDM